MRTMRARESPQPKATRAISAFRHRQVENISAVLSFAPTVGGLWRRAISLLLHGDDLLVNCAEDTMALGIQHLNADAIADFHPWRYCSTGFDGFDHALFRQTARSNG